MQKLSQIIEKIAPIDYNLIEKAQRRLDNLTKPQGSLGRLEELARNVAGITGKENPGLRNKVVFTLASDHGVAEEGVSAFPKEVTAQMVHNFINEGAGINVLARHIGARVIVADIGVAADLKPHPKLLIRKVNYGTKNMRRGPAMTKDEAIRSLETGITIFKEEFKGGIDIAGIGEMGIANTTCASAITSVFTGKPPEETTGKGTGINEQALENKIRVIKDALSINKPDPKDAIDLLAKIGGFEIGGLAGIIIAAASSGVPVVIDGFICGAASLVAYHLQPRVKEYMIASHCSVEKGHRVILDYLGLKPLLNLDMRLGEGTGACLGISIVEAAVKILNEMATFESAGVSEKK